MSDQVFVASGITQGMKVRLTRTALGLTQWQLAHKAGVAQWAVSAYERGDGTRYVPPGWVKQINTALDIESDEAWNGYRSVAHSL